MGSYQCPFLQQFKHNDLWRARRPNFPCLCETFSFPYSIKSCLFSVRWLLALSLRIIYEIHKNKKLRNFLNVHKMQRILFLGSVCCASHLGRNSFYSLLWKQFLMLDKNEITSFLSLSGALCRCFCCHRCCWCERKSFLWKHLLRRFTDCEQLGFSSSSTFWFSASRCTGMHWGNVVVPRSLFDALSSRRFISFSLMTHKNYLRNKLSNVMRHAAAMCVHLIMSGGFFPVLQRTS